MFSVYLFQKKTKKGESFFYDLQYFSCFTVKLRVIFFERYFRILCENFELKPNFQKTQCSPAINLHLVTVEKAQSSVIITRLLQTGG